MQKFNIIYISLFIVWSCIILYSFDLTLHTKSKRNKFKGIVVEKNKLSIKSIFGKKFRYRIEYLKNNIKNEYCYQSYNSNFEKRGSIKLLVTNFGIYTENDMSSHYPLFFIVLFSMSFFINRKIILESKKYFFFFVLVIFLLNSCGIGENYSQLEIMLDDFNNTKNTIVTKEGESKLVINFQLEKSSVDMDRVASKAAMVSSIYCDSKSTKIDSFLVIINNDNNYCQKKYSKQQISQNNQCLMSLSVTLQHLYKQEYAIFLKENLKRLDEDIVKKFEQADLLLGRIKKIDIAGFSQEQNIVNFFLILKRDDKNNRLDLKVDISKCEILEFDM